MPPPYISIQSCLLHLELASLFAHTTFMHQKALASDMEGFGVDDQLLFLPLSDPFVLELNNLHNQLKDKDRELEAAFGEIKALKAIEVQKDRAVTEISNELRKVDEKLQVTEHLLEQKNLEIKKLANEKKEALAAQFAAEAALRRVDANQKDEDFVPIEAVIAPLEADIKMYKNEIAMLQEDKKALERLTKSKEAALIEAEKILKSAVERALIVEEVQNQNFELRRQIEICQEENRILDKTYRQKVTEVEKLSRTIHELEESILDGGAIANAVRDYQRQVSELNEEKRTLERELARLNVSANRIATVVANEWKDDKFKVMPVKQWLEERRFSQGEMQRLREKLLVSERTAKAEAQLKEKLRLRLKTLEESSKQISSYSGNANTSTLQKSENSENALGFKSNNGGTRPRSTSTSRPRTSFVINRSSILQQPNVVCEASSVNGNLKQDSGLHLKYGVGDNVAKRQQWARNKFSDDGEKENEERNDDSDIHISGFVYEVDVPEQIKTKGNGDQERQSKQGLDARNEDTVSGFLYDKLQREVINLRKLCKDKDGTLLTKDQEIKTLLKKVETLSKDVEAESKNVKREAAAREKELTSDKSKDTKQTNRNTNVSRRSLKHQDFSKN